METRCQRRCFRTQRVEVTEWLTVTATGSAKQSADDVSWLSTSWVLACTCTCRPTSFCWRWRTHLLIVPLHQQSHRRRPPKHFPLPATCRPTCTAKTIWFSGDVSCYWWSQQPQIQGVVSLLQVLILDRLKWPLKSEHSTIQSIPLFKTFWEDTRTLFIVANFCSLSAQTSDHLHCGRIGPSTLIRSVAFARWQHRAVVGRLVRLVNKMFICQLSTWRSFVDECAAYIVVSRQSPVVSGSSLLDVYFSTASTQHVHTSSKIDEFSPEWCRPSLRQSVADDRGRSYSKISAFAFYIFEIKMAPATVVKWAVVPRLPDALLSSSMHSEWKKF